jgi:hypothetical protein
VDDGSIGLGVLMHSYNHVNQDSKPNVHPRTPKDMNWLSRDAVVVPQLDVRYSWNTVAQADGGSNMHNM